MKHHVEEILQKIQSTSDYFEKARLLHHLTQADKVRLKDIATALQMKPSYICHILRLNKLPIMISDGFYAELVSISHLYLIARLHVHDDMISVYEKVLAENLSVIETEYLVREILYKTTGTGNKLEKDVVSDIQRLFKKHNIDASISFVQTRIKARITIETKGGVELTSEASKAVFDAIKRGL